MKQAARKGAAPRSGPKAGRPEIELEEGLPFTPLPADAPPQHRVRHWRGEMTRWLEDQHQRLAEVLTGFNAFDMLSSLLVLELGRNPETYQESEHEGQAAVVEYVALTYLGLPHRPGTKPPLGLHSQQVLIAAARARRILFAITQFYASEAALLDPGQHDGLAFLRYKTISHGMFVRNPAYPHHHRQVVEHLFAPFAHWLTEHAGFSVADLFGLEEGIQRVGAEKGREHAQVEKQGQAALTKLAEEVRRGLTGGLHDLPFVRHLASLPRAQASRAIKHCGTAWQLSNLGSSVLTFTNQELAAATGLPVERVAAATAFFSVEVGSAAPGFQWFPVTHVLKSRPLLRDGDQLLYVTPGTLLWAIQPRLEEFINQAGQRDTTQKSTWTRYQKLRGSYLETEALALFLQLLPRAITYQGLKYDLPDERGRKVEYDLDGLVVFDTTLLLLEAKAGGYADAARRGAESSMKSVVKNLLGDAHAQALRAKEYLTSAPTRAFRLPDKTTLTLTADEFTRLIPVTVSLESLDIFNATLHEVANAGLLPAGELPWAVSLDILRVISELNEFPSQFVHYLTRRLRLNDYRKFHAHDELDWYGLYLASGLYYEDDEDVAAADWVNVPSHTDRFDAYYAHQLGVRKTKAAKPRQTMPHQFRQLLAALETMPARGYSDAILALLEWDEEGRRLVAERFQWARQTTRQDGRLHNASFGSLHGSGITIAAAYGADFQRHTAQLLEVVRLRKYQQQASSWLTLLTAVDEQQLIRQFYLDTAAWQPDPQAEQLAAQLKPVQSVTAFRELPR